MNKTFYLILLFLLCSCSTNKIKVNNRDNFCKTNQKTISTRTNRIYDCDFNYSRFKQTIKQFKIKENDLKKYIFLIGCSDAGTNRMTNNYDALIYNIETKKIYQYSTNKYDKKNNPIRSSFFISELNTEEKKYDEFNFLIYNFLYNKNRFDKMLETLKYGSNISEVSCQRFFYYIDNENLENSYLRTFWNGFFKIDEKQ